MAELRGLPEPKRWITTHNAEGKAIFESSLPEEPRWTSMGPVAEFFLGYTTSSFPPNLNGDADLKSYSDYYLNENPGLSIKGGTVLRVVDLAPGTVSPMHRTVSLDYGIIIEGEAELLLDSGEVKRMARGDIAVQRGTMHAWKNPTDKWTRIVFMLQECEAIQMNGTALEEDYGVGMHGVRKST